MSSIEDILNAEDSDDEDLDASKGAVDLEHLLNSKDEFDDNTFLHHKSTKEFYMEEVNMPLKPFNASSDLLKRDEVGDMIEQFEKEQVDNDSGSVVEVEDIHQPITDENGLINNEFNISSLSGLEKADKREKQFLSSGKREPNSALQSKRRSAALLNYSNIKCDDLSKISDQ